MKQNGIKKIRWTFLKRTVAQFKAAVHLRLTTKIYVGNTEQAWLLERILTETKTCQKTPSMNPTFKMQRFNLWRKQSEEAWVRFMFLTDSGAVWKLWQSCISFPDIILIQHLLHITCFWQPVMKWGKGLAKRVFLPWGCQREILCCRDSRQVFVTWVSPQYCDVEFIVI